MVLSFGLRLLCPFRFPVGSAQTATNQLPKDLGCQWQPAGDPTPYAEELLPEAERFLGLPSHYLRLNQPAWFKNSLAVILDEEKDLKWRETFDSQNPHQNVGRRLIALDKDHGVELFLTDAGVGILSFAFSEPENSVPDLDEIQDLNYHLTHTKFRPPVFRLFSKVTDPDLSPYHPSDYDARKEMGVRDRLGQAGQAWKLDELRDLLLEPIEGKEILQKQFLTHLVVKFDQGIDFEPKNEAGMALLPRLVCVSRLEELRHAVVSRQRAVDLCTLISTKHAAAYSNLAAAHFVANQWTGQESDGSFDAERVRVVQRKYFAAYLIALVQRTVIHRSLEEAAKQVREKQEDRWSKLWDEWSRFERMAPVADVSRREPVNECYRLAMRSLHVEEAKRTLHDLFRDHDLNKLAHRQERAEHRLGLIEVFVVMVYATELVHLIAESLHFLHGYAFAGMVIMAALAVWTVLRHHHEAHHEGQSSRWLLTVTVGVLVIWTALGWTAFRMHEKTTCCCEGGVCAPASKPAAATPEKEKAKPATPEK